MRLWKILALFVLAFLTGCASVGTSSTGAPSASQSASVDCEKMLQPGCWEVRVGNYKYNPQSELMAGLDRPYRDQTERQQRAQFLGPRLWEEGFLKDKVAASKPRSFIVFFWNVNNVPESTLAAWQVNGDRTKQYKHVVSRATFEEVKDGSFPTFDPAYDIGKPMKVYRIRADGKDAVAASLQIPWSMVGPKTYILVCSEDKLTVYPNKVTGNEGLWITPESLQWYRDTRKSTRVLIPFISKDG